MTEACESQKYNLKYMTQAYERQEWESTGKKVAIALYDEFKSVISYTLIFNIPISAVIHFFSGTNPMIPRIVRFLSLSLQ